MANNLGSTMLLETSYDLETYECCICSEDIPFEDGVAPCDVHFFCSGCIIDIFRVALTNPEIFPARCCTPISRHLVEHLLSPEIQAAYARKEKEYYTPLAIRVYCSNENCASFISSSLFDNTNTDSTVARCPCGSTTCVGCKRSWRDRSHRCNEGASKPDWLPKYSSTCRIKQCFGCRMWIEHKDACNHMTCHYCKYEFCFVCMLPWDAEEGFHEEAGCPSYGDPNEGYDEEGYENTERGLHRDTGYNRDGENRLGLNHLSVMAGDEQQQQHQQEEFEAEVEELQIEYEDEAELVLLVNEEDFHLAHVLALDFESELEDQPIPEPVVVVEPNAPEVDERTNDGVDNELVAPPSPSPRPVTPDTPGPRHLELTHEERRNPLLVPNPDRTNRMFIGAYPTFIQLNCEHEWSVQCLRYTEYTSAICKGCDYLASEFVHYCRHCGIFACRLCSEDFKHNFSQWLDMVDIFTWAETCEIPYKVERREVEQQKDEDIWGDDRWASTGIETMFEMWEDELFEQQPFIYWGFGIDVMFGGAEKELRREWWGVVVDDVGLPRMRMTFNFATNAFAPLLWEHEQDMEGEIVIPLGRRKRRQERRRMLFEARFGSWW